jgi:hypothetical protein
MSPGEVRGHLPRHMRKEHIMLIGGINLIDYLMYQMCIDGILHYIIQFYMLFQKMSIHGWLVGMHLPGGLPVVLLHLSKMV